MIHQASVFHNKGFTLFETLIYIALLGILIGGMIVTVYPIFDSTSKLSGKVTRDTEVGFLLQKLSWALASAHTISISSSPETITITTYGSPSHKYIFAEDGTNVSFKEDSGTANDILSSRVKVTSLMFQDVPAAGGAPEVVTDFDVNGIHVGPIRHNVH